MPTISLRFPGGRYHATPWGHHVNEGLVEWPPCPWRLLRALIASGFNGQRWSEIPAIGQQLVGKLASVLPTYSLPEGISSAHSRHYMPHAGKQTLIFDTWANVGDGRILVHWPCQLTHEETSLLEQLVASLGYLGRSESWVEAQVVTDNTAQWNAVPCQGQERRGPGWEQISLVAPIPPEEYLRWRKQQIESLPHRPTRARSQDPYPTELLDCLTQDSSWWKKHGWSQPPGSQRVFYWRPSQALEVGVPALHKRGTYASVPMMLLALSTASGNRSALPFRTRTLPQAELLHRAMVSWVGRGQRVDCPELTGLDADGRPLRNGHCHAHTLPVDLDGDERLDHVIVYASMGLSEAAQSAIRSLRRTWTKGGVGELQVAVVGAGELEMLRDLPHPLNKHITSILGPPSGARVWESLTPFVAPKTVDQRFKRSIEGQVNRELANRGLPEAQQIEILAELTKDLRHYVRRRSRGGTPPRADTGFGLRLTFAEPIQGPLLLGYASHYGLGHFGALVDS